MTDLRREIANVYARNHSKKWQTIDDVRPRMLRRLFMEDADDIIILLMPHFERIEAEALELAAEHLSRPEPPFFGAQNPRIIEWLRQRARIHRNSEHHPEPPTDPSFPITSAVQAVYRNPTARAAIIETRDRYARLVQNYDRILAATSTPSPKDSDAY